MRRKHFFAVLSGLAAIALLAADASAMYHPTLGRWMQRDPAPSGGFSPRGPAMASPYEYVCSSPLRYVDWTGATPEEVNTQLGTAYSAVVAGNWQAAHDAMVRLAALRRQGESLTPTRACCCRGDDAKKCHIVVRHLAKLSGYYDAGDGFAKVSAKDLGYPSFPVKEGHKPPMAFAFTGKRFIAGVVTSVYITHDEGKDTSACMLRGDLDDRHWNMRGEPTDASVGEDFGKFFFQGNLNTSQGRNWYIDTPFAPAPIAARFFQMHVRIMDEGGNIISGPEAYYGWAYNAVPNPGTYSLNWKVWPDSIGANVVDPKEKLKMGDVMRGLGR